MSPAHVSTSKDVAEETLRSQRAGPRPAIRMSTDEPVASNFRAQFKLDRGVLNLRDATFTIPGAVVQASGTYGLASRDPALRRDRTHEGDGVPGSGRWGEVRAAQGLIDPLFRTWKCGRGDPDQDPRYPKRSRRRIGLRANVQAEVTLTPRCERAVSEPRDRSACRGVRGAKSSDSSVRDPPVGHARQSAAMIAHST